MDLRLFYFDVANYNNHPSILIILEKNALILRNIVFLKQKKEEKEINILIERLNPKRATEPDGIPLKIIKLSVGVPDKHLTNIINTDLECSCFSENAEICFF